MLFLDCDEDLRVGDLVELSCVASMSYILMTLDTRDREERTTPATALYLGHTWVDYNIDKEYTPLVLHSGRQMVVSRGRVRRVDSNI